MIIQVASCWHLLVNSVISALFWELIIQTVLVPYSRVIYTHIVVEEDKTWFSAFPWLYGNVENNERKKHTHINKQIHIFHYADCGIYAREFALCVFFCILLCCSCMQVWAEKLLFTVRKQCNLTNTWGRIKLTGEGLWFHSVVLIVLNENDSFWILLKFHSKNNCAYYGYNFIKSHFNERKPLNIINKNLNKPWQLLHFKNPLQIATLKYSSNSFCLQQISLPIHVSPVKLYRPYQLAVQTDRN